MNKLLHPRQWLLAGLLTATMSKPVPIVAQSLPSDSGKVYTFVRQMPVYPGGRGYLLLLADLRREFQAASGPAGCAVPTSPVNVNLLVGPSGVIYWAEFVNNRPTGAPAGASRATVATTPPGPALPAACETALAVAIRHLPRLQPGTQGGHRQTVQLTLPLVPKP